MEVAVVIPTHDRPEGLRRALASVADQTRPPDEVVVVDDGSAAAVREDVLEALPAGVASRLIRNAAPRGAADARNQGVAATRSDILMFLDDDDSWTPPKLARQLARFEADPAVGLVYSSRLVVDGDRDDRPRYMIAATRSGSLAHDIFQRNLIGTTSGVALRRDVFEAAGGFDPALPAMQDYDLWLRCAPLCRVAADPEPTVIYRMSPRAEGQISGDLGRKSRAVRYVLEKYRDREAEVSAQGRRRFRSSLYLQVGRTARGSGIGAALPWIARSLWQWPNLRAVGLLAPPGLAGRVRRLLQGARTPERGGGG